MAPIRDTREQVAPIRDAQEQVAPIRDAQVQLVGEGDLADSSAELVVKRQALMGEGRGPALSPMAGGTPDDGCLSRDGTSHVRGGCAEPYTGGSLEPQNRGHTKPSSGGPQKEHADPLQRGHKEPPRVGGLIESPRELGSTIRPRPPAASPVFARHASQTPPHRPTSNLLMSMSAGSPAATGLTPPPVRRVSSPKSPKSCVASSRHGDTGNARSGDEDLSSVSSDEELIAPLSMALPPAKRVVGTEDPFSHHHPHHHDTALSPKVKDCISQMTKIVHTEPLFSEPKKMHSRRQRNKLAIIPEDSPTVSS